MIEPAIKALVHKLAERCWEGGEVDGGDLQEWLSEAGVLVETTVNEPCCDSCVCADFSDFPTTCYRFAPEWK